MNSAADPSAIGMNGQDPTGYSTRLQSAVDYGFQGHSVTARASATSSQRYFRPDDRVAPAYFRSISHTGGVDVSVRAARTTLEVNATTAYSASPLYALVLPVAQATDVDIPWASRDVAVSNFDAYVYGTTATLSHRLTRRNAMSFAVDWRRTDMSGSPDVRRQLNMYGLRTQMSHRLGRNMTTEATYAYRIGEMRDANPVMMPWRLPEHRAELAINYRRSLSPTRHVTFGASVGASTMLVPQVIPTATERRRRDNPFSTDLAAGYEFARTWRLRTAYRQSVDYVPGLSEPVSATSVTTGMDGLLSRRVDVTVSAGYSNGQSAITTGTSAYETYTAEGRLRCALTRTTAAYVEYVSYFYDSKGALPLGPGIPLMLERRGVRAGVMVRLPIF